MKKESTDRRAPLPRASGYSREFKKDWNRYTKAGKSDMNRVTELMELIIFKKPLGAEWSDHALSGKEWKGAREAHIGGDFLLVYLYDDESVQFVRLGTHSELFGR
ncbi:type II toxin-antitoxin system YafQ family toxin [Pararhizobium sp.]|uniref:type II toxin-antitoxin system YafQ family toxin n=1 Tax=Pararhizobium sp. TaxID=1977563 RepID=UPI0027156D74|nr:type II toxin-antitoxin system YafQ family toxin [Pararhizobium sp.]MDO9418991.1 type II toxin-antitoxin system YafQ family toxin [Pararhizobium sp.]